MDKRTDNFDADQLFEELGVNEIIQQFINSQSIDEILTDCFNNGISKLESLSQIAKERFVKEVEGFVKNDYIDEFKKTVLASFKESIAKAILEVKDSFKGDELVKWVQMNFEYDYFAFFCMIKEKAVEYLTLIMIDHWKKLYENRAPKYVFDNIDSFFIGLLNSRPTPGAFLASIIVDDPKYNF